MTEQDDRLAEIRAFADHGQPSMWRDDVRLLLAEMDAARAAHTRVVANEGNHYDRYWTPPAEPVSDEWLADTEAKMREALTDVFCDDAAAVMLTLIAEIRRLRTAS